MSFKSSTRLERRSATHVALTEAQVPFPAPQGDSQPSTVPVPGESVPSSDLVGTRHTYGTHTYMEVKRSYTLKKKVHSNYFF